MMITVIFEGVLWRCYLPAPLLAFELGSEPFVPTSSNSSADESNCDDSEAGSVDVTGGVPAMQTVMGKARPVVLAHEAPKVKRRRKRVPRARPARDRAAHSDVAQRVDALGTASPRQAKA